MLVMNGRMLRTAMRNTFVPRQRDARLYSRSRMMMTCVRMKYAMLIQPVTVRANTIVQKLGEKISTSTEISRMYGTFATTL